MVRTQFSSLASFRRCLVVTRCFGGVKPEALIGVVSETLQSYTSPGVFRILMGMYVHTTLIDAKVSAQSARSPLLQ